MALLKALPLGLALLAAVAAATDPDWEGYKAKWGKKYKDAAEDAKRYSIFQSSQQRVAARNAEAAARGEEAVFGLTKFADRSPAEFSVLLGRKKKTGQEQHDPLYEAPVANFSSSGGADGACVDSVDWRTSPGVVSWVRDQGQCGSCWSFSAAETIESQMALAGNAPMEFSPQQIAANTPQMDGCAGGDTVYAYHYVMNKFKNNPLGGLSTEHYCPYTQSMWLACDDPACTAQCDGGGPSWDSYATEFPVARLSGFTYASAPCNAGACKASKADLERLRCNVAAGGPVSICVNAGAWNDYTGGILSAAACGGSAAADIDHCVQLVGYHKDATNASLSYWLVRNSWSTNWGENGYIRLQLDENTCGLANEATIPTISA